MWGVHFLVVPSQCSAGFLIAFTYRRPSRQRGHNPATVGGLRSGLRGPRADGPMEQFGILKPWCKVLLGRRLRSSRTRRVGGAYSGSAEALVAMPNTLAIDFGAK